MSSIPLVSQAELHEDRIALTSSGVTSTYRDLVCLSQAVASALLGERNDLNEARVALLVPPGTEYVAGQWGIWLAGGIMLPLCLSATDSEWEYALTDSNADVLLTTRDLIAKVGSVCHRLQRRIIIVEEAVLTPIRSLPEIAHDRRAMILYTSGTTSKPKGVVTTHANIQSQIESLVAAWESSASDRIPLFLPLHHIHGIINVLSCALWCGAQVDVYSKFDAETQLNRIRTDAYTVFMAVPTIYVKLIQVLQSQEDEDRFACTAGFGRLRLMVSGSAALPGSVHDEWFQLTGQKLLERYGMTEIGMALSNPYRGERRPGCVGMPLPGVEVRLKTEAGTVIHADSEAGEIQVRGPGVFREYWNRPETTSESFDDGWFRTGDVAIVDAGYFRIMGRQSVDIIKSGGYKLSALEIEATLLEHPRISECAVVGMPDATWGEAVTAVIVLKGSERLELGELREWCKSRISAYKIPQRMLLIDELPRNAMGKVTKPAVKDLVSSRCGLSD